VGGGGGLKLVVVEGRVRLRLGREHRSGYPTRALERRRLSGVGLEVLGVLGGMPGGRIVARWPRRSRPNPEAGPVLRAFYFCCEFVLKACPSLALEPRSRVPSPRPGR
jgi:hypothetical protein